MARQLLVAIGLCLTLVVPAAAQQRAGRLPTLGDEAEMTLSAERRLGEKIAREIYQDPDFIDDPILAEYVEQIWRRLLAAARERGELTPELEERFAWEIMMGRDRSVNAFALPGGYLGVHLGLIGLVGTRDELASVLAHELSHVTQRHISRLMTKQNQQTPWIIGAMILSALAASKRPDAASAIAAGGQALAIQGQLNFSRDMEREADRIGYGVLEQAGFDTRGFASMFDKLQQASRLNDYGTYPYLRTHPLTTERIADMTSRQPPGAQRPAEDGSDLEHLMVAGRARALSQLGVESLHMLVSEADSAKFDGQPTARQAALLYQAAQASVRLREFAKADTYAARLVPLVRADARATRLANLLLLELAQERHRSGPATANAGAGAAQVLQSSALLSDGSRRRPELLLGASLLIQAGRAGEATQWLQTWVAEHPRDAAAWQLLATSSGIQGQALRSIRAEAEARVAHYDYTAALDRFKAAQELIQKAGTVRTGADHLEASIIDARARQVASLAREQALER